MMRKLIDQQQEAERIQNKLNEVFQYPKTEYAEGFVNACKAVLRMLDSLPSVDAVPVEWIKEEIEGLREMNTDFAMLTASIISTMLKRYRKED